MKNKTWMLLVLLALLTACNDNNNGAVSSSSLNSGSFDSVESFASKELSDGASESTAKENPSPTPEHGTTPNEPIASDEPKPTYTREDYDEMRKSLPYEPFEIDYDAEYVQNGYLEIDKTAGILEEYIGYALIGLLEVREIPDVLQDNDLIFQTAGFCTNSFRMDENLLIKNAGDGFSATPKEHLDLTVKYIYGGECVIDYEKLSRIFNSLEPNEHPYYEYAEEFGLALRYFVVKEGISPIVLDYQDLGDSFQVTVVFLNWDTFLPLEYDYYYYDKAAPNSWDNSIYLNKEKAKAFCFSDQPDKYILRIDKGENDKLYLRSMLLAS